MRAQKSREKIGSNAGTQRESKASEPPKQRAKGAAEIKLYSRGEVLEPRTVAVFIRCEEREPSYAEAVGKARGQISLE